MFSALSQIWAAIAAIFSAFERSANALDHLARSGEEAAEDYANKARADRQNNGETGNPKPTADDIPKS